MMWQYLLAIQAIGTALQNLEWIFKMFIFIFQLAGANSIYIDQETGSAQYNQLLDEISQKKVISMFKTIYFENNKTIPVGLFFFKWGIGYHQIYSKRNQSCELWLTGWDSQLKYWYEKYQQKQKKKDDLKEQSQKKPFNPVTNKKVKIVTYEPSGQNYWNLSFISNTQRQRLIQYNNEHARLVYWMNNRIRECILKNETINGKLLISGSVGTGKTRSVDVLAYVFGGVIVRDWDPTKPTTLITQLINQIQPSQQTPLFILMDEWDQKVQDCMNGKVQQHKYFPIQLYDKSSHNALLEKLEEHDWVFTIFTTNKPFEWFDQIDKSLIRDGRMTHKTVFNKSKIQKIGSAVSLDKLID